MNFLDLIIKEGYIMIAALWIIGLAIKRSDVLNDKYILPVLIIISLCFTPWLLGGYTAINFVQAVLVAGGSVLIDQVYKQSFGEKLKGFDRNDFDEETTYGGD